MQSLNDAARLATSGYPGGLAALCVRMDWSYETARKEIAGAAGFKLGAERLRHISEFCIEAGGENAHAILRAFNGGHGGFIKLEVREMGGAKTLPTNTAKLLGECSDVVSAVTAALADGSISPNERRAIRKELMEMLEAQARVDGDIDADERTTSLRAVG